MLAASTALELLLLSRPCWQPLLLLSCFCSLIHVGSLYCSRLLLIKVVVARASCYIAAPPALSSMLVVPPALELLLISVSMLEVPTALDMLLIYHLCWQNLLL
jgi:hypothetical protein